MALRGEGRLVSEDCVRGEEGNAENAGGVEERVGPAEVLTKAGRGVELERGAEAGAVML